MSVRGNGSGRPGARVALAVAGALMAVLVAGCGESKPDDPVDSIPPGPDVSPPPVTQEPVSPAPSVSVNAAAACLTKDDLFTALTYHDPDSPPPPQTKVTAGPVCAAGWGYAAIEPPGQEGVGVVLRHHGGRWQVLTLGSTPCAEPRVDDAPPKVRTAAGC
jgi:hypothetical protein